MTYREREEQALDALVASFFHISIEDAVGNVDDPAVLDDDDRKAINALGDDLVDRLIAGKQAGAESRDILDFPASAEGPNLTSVPPEVMALHRGDADLPPEVIEEIEQHRRELLEDEEADFEE